MYDDHAKQYLIVADYLEKERICWNHFNDLRTRLHKLLFPQDKIFPYKAKLSKREKVRKSNPDWEKLVGHFRVYLKPEENFLRDQVLNMDPQSSVLRLIFGSGGYYTKKANKQVVIPARLDASGVSSKMATLMAPEFKRDASPIRRRLQIWKENSSGIVVTKEINDWAKPESRVFVLAYLCRADVPGKKGANPNRRLFFENRDIINESSSFADKYHDMIISISIMHDDELIGVMAVDCIKNKGLSAAPDTEKIFSIVEEVIFNHAKDFSELKNYYARNHEDLNRLISMSGEGFFIIDRDARLVMTSKSSQNLFGHHELYFGREPHEVGTLYGMYDPEERDDYMYLKSSTPAAYKHCGYFVHDHLKKSPDHRVKEMKIWLRPRKFEFYREMILLTGKGAKNPPNFLPVTDKMVSLNPKSYLAKNRSRLQKEYSLYCTKEIISMTLRSGEELLSHLSAQSLYNEKKEYLGDFGYFVDSATVTRAFRIIDKIKKDRKDMNPKFSPYDYICQILATRLEAENCSILLLKEIPRDHWEMKSGRQGKFIYLARVGNSSWPSSPNEYRNYFQADEFYHEKDPQAMTLRPFLKSNKEDKILEFFPERNEDFQAEKDCKPEYLHQFCINNYFGEMASFLGVTIFNEEQIPIGVIRVSNKIEVVYDSKKNTSDFRLVKPQPVNMDPPANFYKKGMTRGQTHPFTDHDRLMLKDAAKEIALYLDGIIQNKYEEILHALDRNASKTDFDVFIKEVVDKLTEDKLVGFRFATFRKMIQQDRSSLLRLQAISDKEKFMKVDTFLNKPDFDIEKGDMISGWALKEATKKNAKNNIFTIGEGEDKPLDWPNKLKGFEKEMRLMHLQSGMVAVVFNGPDPIGTLSCYSTCLGRFGKRENHFLRSLSFKIAQAYASINEYQSFLDKKVIDVYSTFSHELVERNIYCIFIDLRKSTDFFLKASKADKKGKKGNAISKFIQSFRMGLMDIINEHDGMVDKFEGDSIMILFNFHNKYYVEAGEVLECIKKGNYSATQLSYAHCGDEAIALHGLFD